MGKAWNEHFIPFILSRCFALPPKKKHPKTYGRNCYLPIQEALKDESLIYFFSDSMLDFLGEITQLTKILNMNMKLQEIFTNVTDVDRWFSQQKCGWPRFLKFPSTGSMEHLSENVFAEPIVVAKGTSTSYPLYLVKHNNLTSIGNKPPNKKTYPPGN